MSGLQVNVKLMTGSRIPGVTVFETGAVRLTCTMQEKLRRRAHGETRSIGGRSGMGDSGVLTSLVVGRLHRRTSAGILVDADRDFKLICLLQHVRDRDVRGLQGGRTHIDRQGQDWECRHHIVSRCYTRRRKKDSVGQSKYMKKNYQVLMPSNSS